MLLPRSLDVSLTFAFTSTSTRKSQNVMAPELLICILSSELPLDGSAQRVSSGLPGVDFVLQKLWRWDSAIQTLATEDTNLDLCHVEPTRVLGRVVEAYPAQQCVGRTLASKPRVRRSPATCSAASRHCGA